MARPLRRAGLEETDIAVSAARPRTRRARTKSADKNSNGMPPPTIPTAILIESGSVMRITWQKRSINFSMLSPEANVEDEAPV